MSDPPLDPRHYPILLHRDSKSLLDVGTSSLSIAENGTQWKGAYLPPEEWQVQPQQRLTLGRSKHRPDGFCRLLNEVKVGATTSAKARAKASDLPARER